MKHCTTAVASRALIRALRNEYIEVSDIQRAVDDPPNRQTIYRVLPKLEAHEWTEQDGKTWRHSYRAQALGDSDDDARSKLDLSADQLHT